MNLSLRHQSISLRRTCLKSLILVLMLSFIGQALALPVGCVMQPDDVNSANSVMAEELPPCHQSSLPIAAADRVTPDQSESMSCCDSLSSGIQGVDSSQTHGHDCSCPDSGCSLLFSLLESVSHNQKILSDSLAIITTIALPKQINSALFRPPIA